MWTERASLTRARTPGVDRPVDRLSLAYFRASRATAMACPGDARGPRPVRAVVVLREGARGITASSGGEQLSQNWHGQGESDCLIKTKHWEGRRPVLTQCDFCPVL